MWPPRASGAVPPCRDGDSEVQGPGTRRPHCESGLPPKLTTAPTSGARAVCRADSNPLLHHSSPARKAPGFPPFYKRTNGGTERLSDLPKFTLRANGGVGSNPCSLTHLLHDVSLPTCELGGNLELASLHRGGWTSVHPCSCPMTPRHPHGQQLLTERKAQKLVALKTQLPSPHLH